MKSIIQIIILLLLCAAPRSYAAINSWQEFELDFRNKADAQSKATWSDPDKITISEDGLGWDGEGAASRDGWIQTKPFALGLSWRPTCVISMRFAIHPPPHEITLGNNQRLTPDPGDVYVRYSPDLTHWSSWQVLERAEPQSIQEKKNPGRYYSGTCRVPYRERQEYSKLLSEYSRLDVPWKSDEEAAVEWILLHDPEFFSKHLPFIGYVEFLFEGSFHGGQRIQSVKAGIGWGVGGLHSQPKDNAVYKNRNGPWRYQSKQRRKAEPGGSANPSQAVGRETNQASPAAGSGR